MDQKELLQKYKELRIFEKLEKIGEKHALHIDQIGQLDSETSALIMGTTPREKFVGEITKSLEISPGKAELIAQDVNTDIMLVIRESLKTPPSPEEPVAPPVLPPAPQETKDDMIHSIEQPDTLHTSVNILQNHLEQRMLSGPTTASAVTEEVKPPLQAMPSQAPKEEKKKVSYAADPYRESF